MANVVITIPLVGATTTIPGFNQDNYIIEDSGIMLANYVLTATVPVRNNRVITVWYKGNLDITTNNTNIFLFGHDITQEKLDKDGIFTFSWNGATWDMLYSPDFEESSFIQPSKLVAPQTVRTITQIINYDTAVSPMVYTIFNPYPNSLFYNLYVKEVEGLVGGDAEFTFVHNQGGFAPNILFSSGTNGITGGGMGLVTVPFGTLGPSFWGEIEPAAFPFIAGDPKWEIQLSGAATSGVLELTMIFGLFD